MNEAKKEIDWTTQIGALLGGGLMAWFWHNGAESIAVFWVVACVLIITRRQAKSLGF